MKWLRIIMSSVSFINTLRSLFTKREVDSMKLKISNNENKLASILELDVSRMKKDINALKTIVYILTISFVILFILLVVFTTLFFIMIES